MTLRTSRIPAAFVFGTLLLASSALAQTHPAAPESPYGGTTVEDIVARVNDQIITHSDYDRAMKEMDDEAKQHGATMQQISEAHKELLRNLIDQQLWLSKGKELGITGETELIKRLDEIRKQYNLETIEDLEKAAKEQGVSFEDFKANIRNGIITQEVMRQEVGRKVQFTQGEVERYFEAHKQEYARPGERTAERDSGLNRRAGRLPTGRPLTRQRWPQPRPKPTTLRPSSMPAATLANWRRPSVTAPRPRRAAIWANISAANWAKSLKMPDICVEDRPVHGADSHAPGLPYHGCC